MSVVWACVLLSFSVDRSSCDPEIKVFAPFIDLIPIVRPALKLPAGICTDRKCKPDLLMVLLLVTTFLTPLRLCVRGH